MDSKTLFRLHNTNSCNIYGASIYLAPLCLRLSLNLGLRSVSTGQPFPSHIRWLYVPLLPKACPGVA